MTRHCSVTAACLALGLGLLLANDALARAPSVQAGKKRTELIVPLTLQDLTGKSNVALSVAMVPAEDFFGMGLMIGGQYSASIVSVGLSLPMALAKPDKIDARFVIGNPNIDVRLHHCFEGDVTVCVGGSVAAGFGVMEVESDEDDGFGGGSSNGNEEKTLTRLLAWTSGLMGYQDPLYFAPETAVIRPLALAGIFVSDFQAQAEVGPSILVPMLNTGGRDTEVMLLYRLAAAYRVARWVAPILEFSGMTPMTDEDGDSESELFLNLGLRFMSKSGAMPAIRLTFPLEEHEKGMPYVHVFVGLTYQFGKGKGGSSRRSLFR